MHIVNPKAHSLSQSIPSMYINLVDFISIKGGPFPKVGS